MSVSVGRIEDIVLFTIALCACVCAQCDCVCVDVCDAICWRFHLCVRAGTNIHIVEYAANESDEETLTDESTAFAHTQHTGIQPIK